MSPACTRHRLPRRVQRRAARRRVSQDAPSAHAMARIRAFSLDLWRAALFLWMSWLPAMQSMTGTALVYASSAAGLSPPSMALTTCLIRVRNSERRLALCWRRFSPCRARLRACDELANAMFSGCAVLNGAKLCDFARALSMYGTHFLFFGLAVGSNGLRIIRPSTRAMLATDR